MKIILSILLFCTLLLADRSGPYVGFGYGLSQFDDDGIYKELKENGSTSMTLYGGAYINKHLSVELGFINFTAGNSYEAVDATNQTKELSFSSLNVSTLVHYAFFDDTLDFYGKFGVGDMTAGGVGSTGFTMLVGAGVGVRFSEMLSMKVAYDRYITDYEKDGLKNEMHVDFIYTAFEVQF
ncbi:hypothetical protein SMGD1_2316 [Sulfurimonas gotlandica GD1]|uniref:Outer membrane protein beta-barrel domain-containing protein n=1 Tax=Sulfurimonas gotlandica (strain DSM 19862 / JCM 16533 / GD1) TaxID=929558 RepID=H1FYM2_SULGG|nr:outer membrane beta-barrel protein [Sulfurimonas gotlandica]EHP30837.1 hypothetical protein SMGD1_2316 [Sulfurimonas gotlandica GD1]